MANILLFIQMFSVLSEARKTKTEFVTCFISFLLAFIRRTRISMNIIHLFGQIEVVGFISLNIEHNLSISLFSINFDRLEYRLSFHSLSDFLSLLFVISSCHQYFRIDSFLFAKFTEKIWLHRSKIERRHDRMQNDRKWSSRNRNHVKREKRVVNIEQSSKLFLNRRAKWKAKQTMKPQKKKKTKSANWVGHAAALFNRRSFVSRSVDRLSSFFMHTTTAVVFFLLAHAHMCVCLYASDHIRSYFAPLQSTPIFSWRTRQPLFRFLLQSH